MSIRAIRELVEREGLALVSSTQGKHIKTRVRRGDGREFLVVFPCTSKSKDGLLNKRAELRRLARA